MSELVLETDESIAIDVRGLPTCSPSLVREPSPLRGCGNAIVGEGTAGFDFHFPEQPPIPAKVKLIIYNFGPEAGPATLYAYIYVARPITIALFVPIRIDGIQEGRFASRATVTVPKIANGAGSLTSIRMKIGKSFVRNGQRVSVLTAKCPNGKTPTRVKAKFFDGTIIRSRLVRDCVPSD
jgi:hypothetical protein